MITQQQIKYIRALAVQKYRQMYRNFIVEGEKINAELLTNAQISIKFVYGTERWAAANPHLVSRVLDKFNIISDIELEKISTLKTPNSVISVVEIPEYKVDTHDLNTNLSFYLDGIRDPGNMGTILRIADWFGVKNVYCAPDCTDPFSPKVIQAGMGAFLRVHAQEINFDALLAQSPQLPVMGAVLDGEDLYTALLPPYGLLVIGHEAQGIRPAVMDKLTHRLTIARHPGGGAESLNAGVATGIFTAFLRRI